MKKIRISQSLIKAFLDVKRGAECGKKFQAIYIDKTASFPPSNIQAAGNWFEYIGTGATLRSGEIPETKLMKSKIKETDKWLEHVILCSKSVKIPNEILQDKSDLLKMYDNLLVQSKRLKEAFEYYGVEILETGKNVTIDCGEYERKGIIDVYCKFHKMRIDGELLESFEAIIDIKSTGLLYDKWQPYGWSLESLQFKHKLMLQPIDYKTIFKIAGLQDDIPFFFFVHSNSNEIDSAIIKIDVTDNVLNEHNVNVQQIYQEIKEELSFPDGFSSNPDVKRCFDCPLKSKCAFEMTVPKVNVININEYPKNINT